MNTITSLHLDIYQKYNGEYALLWERGANEKDRSLISEKQFETIGKIVQHLKWIGSGSFSEKLIKEMQAEIQGMKQNLDIRVYERIESEFSGSDFPRKYEV